MYAVGCTPYMVGLFAVGAKIFLLKDRLEELALPLGENDVGRSGRAPLLLGTAAEASDVFAGVFHAMSARRSGADLEERTVC